jgi:hypothetical protein
MSDRFELEKLKVIAATAKRFIDADKEYRKCIFGGKKIPEYQKREKCLVELYKVTNAYFSEGK